MKTLILHVGLHKTGSTSIQKDMSSSGKLLAAKKYHYPVFETQGKPFINHSVPLRYAFGDPKRLPFYKNLVDIDQVRAREAFLFQLRQLKTAQDDIILSAEGVSNFNEDSYEAITRFFADWNIRVIAYIRSAYSYHCSAVQERIKTGNPISVGEKLMCRSQDIARLTRYFNNITFYDFNAVCRSGGGPVTHFREVLGLPAPTGTPSRENVGLGNVAVRVANEVNRHFPIKSNGKYNRKSEMFDAIKFAVGDQAFRLTGDELAKLESQIEAENQRLNELTGLSLSEKELSCAVHSRLPFKTQLTLLGKVKKLPSELQAIISTFLLREGFIHPRLVTFDRMLPVASKTIARADVMRIAAMKVKNRVLSKR